MLSPKLLDIVGLWVVGMLLEMEVELLFSFRFLLTEDGSMLFGCTGHVGRGVGFCANEKRGERMPGVATS